MSTNKAKVCPQNNKKVASKLNFLHCLNLWIISISLKFSKIFAKPQAVSRISAEQKLQEENKGNPQSSNELEEILKPVLVNIRGSQNVRTSKKVFQYTEYTYESTSKNSSRYQLTGRKRNERDQQNMAAIKKQLTGTIAGGFLPEIPEMQPDQRSNNLINQLNSFTDFQPETYGYDDLPVYSTAFGNLGF